MVVVTEEDALEEDSSGEVAGGVVEVGCEAKGVVTGIDAFSVVEVCETELVVVTAWTGEEDDVDSVA